MRGIGHHRSGRTSLAARDNNGLPFGSHRPPASGRDGSDREVSTAGLRGRDGGAQGRQQALRLHIGFQANNSKRWWWPCPPLLYWPPRQSQPATVVAPAPPLMNARAVRSPARAQGVREPTAQKQAFCEAHNDLLFSSLYRYYVGGLPITSISAVAGKDVPANLPHIEKGGNASTQDVLPIVFVVGKDVPGDHLTSTEKGDSASMQDVRLCTAGFGKDVPVNLTSAEEKYSASTQYVLPISAVV